MKHTAMTTPMTPDAGLGSGRVEGGGVPARILVVDDHPANIQVVGGVLGKLGYEIVPASDGKTALRRIAVHLPDLILLDLIMPEMDGCEVCRQLQANPEWRDIPVIFLSAADDKDLIVRALESGGVDYVTKPFHHAELISRVRTQLALKTARDRLVQLAQDKDELLGILAHDLKNHLGGIELSARLLRDRVRLAEAGNAQASQLAENIVRTGGNLLTFVKEFLANAAADHGVSVTLSPQDFSGAAAAAAEQYREAAGQKELTLEVRVLVGDSTVFADATALAQVLDNLVSNAVKFSPPGRRIVVTVEPGDVDVACGIRDEGPGFTPEDRLRMFRRYARLSARPTGSEPSTGLGLSIVHKLVRAMNGELSFDSAPGQGTNFVVRLPRPSAS